MKPDLRDNVIDCHRSRGRSRVMCSDFSYLAVGNAYVITIRLPCSISQHLILDYDQVDCLLSMIFTLIRLSHFHP